VLILAFLRRLCLAALLLALPATGRAAVPAPVGADHAMVVSAQALASQVGLDILKRGGNVVDAAVAVGYALAVVYPAAGNLGGGGFMTLRFADGRTTFLDFREKAPLTATPGMFTDEKGEVVRGRSTDSWLAVGVPGSVAGLDAALARYGSLPRDVVMAPAIALARDGFVLSEGDALFLKLAEGDLADDPAAAAIFLREGHAPAAGERLTQPALARTLDAIREKGAAGFYAGPLAEAIAAASAAGGGLITMADLAQYRVRELPTVACSYRGYAVESAPPPSSGGVTLCEMLNILEGYDLGRMGFHSAEAVHVMAEAMRHAYHDRNARLGDPAFVSNPVTELTDKAFAAAIRKTIPAEAAGRNADLDAEPAEQPQTTHFSIADAAGNAASVTTTLNGWFGARRVAGDTGVLMNNEMDDFTVKPGTANSYGLVQGTANAVQPGKTPLSSMSPTVVTRDGRLVLVIGSPGGSRIITTVLETVLNLVDHGMTLSEAIDAPRIHMQGLPDVIATEPYALSAETAARLRQEGYKLATAQPWSLAAGILMGGPRLGPPEGEAHALALPDRVATRHALYGAVDARSPTGAALGY
jgi:gamma-glutamyltranspeptidase/glutathione hydrolase